MKSTVTPLIVEILPNETIPNYVTIINPDGSISYERNIHYQRPTIIRRNYATVRRTSVIKQVHLLIIMLFHYRLITLFNRKENLIVVVNGVEIGVLVNVLHVIFVIVY